MRMESRTEAAERPTRSIALTPPARTGAGRSWRWAAALIALAMAGCGDGNPSGPSTVARREPTVPTLVSPLNGTSVSNDCSGDVWEFRWSELSNASAYQIRVSAPDGSIVIDADDLTLAEYTWTRPDLIEESRREGWLWRVRARIGGEWRDWSPEESFEVDPLHPVLLSPEDGAVLDNGCSNGGDPIVWRFDWSDCRSADRYELFVKANAAAFAVIDRFTTGSDLTSVSNRSYIVPSNGLDWRWRVRARLNGIWRDWSEERSFDVELLNTDCPGL